MNELKHKAGDIVYTIRWSHEVAAYIPTKETVVKIDRSQIGHYYLSKYPYLSVSGDIIFDNLCAARECAIKNAEEICRQVIENIREAAIKVAMGVK